MDIAVFGLGYVGAVSAACLADRGHRVIGVDTNPVKVDLMNQGQSPIVEGRLPELVARARASGRLQATADWHEAVARTEMAWICVSTPSQANGSIDTRYLRVVGEQLGQALGQRGGHYSIVVRSTVLPGTTRGEFVPVVERCSGRGMGDGFEVSFHPEFLREGSAVADFYDPSLIIIGAMDPRKPSALASLYGDMSAPIRHTSVEVAETVKYASNAWHALKVCFANEIGTFCRQHGVDGREVMDLFAQDRKLNLSEKYLRPGFAFGGSCLPKDVRALVYQARRHDLDLPLLNAVLPSNQRHVERAFDLVVESGRRRVGLMGLSFKPGTDDLRESPLVELAERLIGKGYEVRIFDPNVNLSVLLGANRDYIQTRIPHVSRLMVDSEGELLAHAEVVVLGHKDPAYQSALGTTRPDLLVIDLAGFPPGSVAEGSYRGICW
jgi:GDP-mannose 6-dehydrogenase